LFFFNKEEVDTYYLSATTGALISLEKDQMHFHKLVTKSAGKLKDLDDDENVMFMPRLPQEIPRIPKVKIGRDKIYATLRITLGVQPIDSELVLLPVWTLKVKHKKKNKRRKIFMDAATGRILTGNFRTTRRSSSRKR
jgi:hypothetical protein